jgi:hypothetical protein
MTTNKNPSEYGEYSDQYILGASDKLDEYGVWVKSPPQSLDETQAAPLADAPLVLEPLAAPLAVAPLAAAPPADAPPVDAAPAVPIEEGEAMFPPELLSDFGKDIEGLSDDALNPQDAETPPFIEEQQDAASEHDTSDFDMPDISLFASEADSLEESFPEAAEPALPDKADTMITPEPETPHEDKVNMELLNRVIDELALIRDELAGIRQELNRVNERSATERPAEPTKPPEPEPPASTFPWDNAEFPPSSQSSGFFDDDDDKIVLTGDELNNIFNTANLIQKDSFEPSQDEPYSEDPPPYEPPAPQKIPTLEETLAELGEDLELAVPTVVAHSEELNQLLEEGLKPITEPPLDTSYLEEPPAYTNSATPDLDLSDAVIEEPEPSESIEERPLEEPSIESIENLEGVDEISLDDFPQQDATKEAQDDKNLIDDLLIDNGSIKDFPVELDMEQDEDEDSLDFDDEDNNEDDDATSLEVPFLAADWEGSVESIITDADLDMETLVEEPDEIAGEHEALLSEPEISEPYREEIEMTELPAAQTPPATPLANVTNYFTQELKHVLAYMDQILDSLPDDKIEAFTRSQHFDTYKQVFNTLGLT